MNSLFARLLKSYLVVLLTAVVVTGGAVAYLYSENVFDAREKELLKNGRQLAALLEGGLNGQQPPVLLRARIEGIAQTLNAGITIANKEGYVVLTTYNVSRMRSLDLSQSDVQRVLDHGDAITRRGYEEAVQEAVVAALVPIRGPDGVAGAVVLYAPMEGTMATIRGARNILLWGVLLAVLTGAAVSYGLSRRITAPIREMTRASMEMSHGNFDLRVDTSETGEIGALGRAFNDLSARLGETIGELTREKQKTGLILESMSEGVVAVDRQGVILLANPAITRLLGLEEEPIGTEIEAVVGLAGLWPHIERSLHGETVAPGEIRQEDRVLAVHGAPLRDEDEEIVGAVVILHDVTERYKLERMRRDFLANVSHELRTPLTSIRGFAQAILDGMVSREDQIRRYLHVIMDESLRLTRLVNTVLDLSRIESNAVKLAFEPVDPAAVIADAVESLEPIAADRELHITSDVGPLPLVRADRDWMAQIFVNLLENAVRHSPKGSTITVMATSDTSVTPPQVEIAVEDEGEGIPEEDLPYIWERFYKVDKSRRYQQGVGTGLGLVIVKEVVAMHGGTVRAANRPEGGARFTLTLPAHTPTFAGDKEPVGMERVDEGCDGEEREGAG